MSRECGSSVPEQSVPGLTPVGQSCLRAVGGSPEAARGQRALLELEMSHKTVPACPLERPGRGQAGSQPGWTMARGVGSVPVAINKPEVPLGPQILSPQALSSTLPGIHYFQPLSLSGRNVQTRQNSWAEHEDLEILFEVIITCSGYKPAKGWGQHHFLSPARCAEQTKARASLYRPSTAAKQKGHRDRQAGPVSTAGAALADPSPWAR